MALLDAYSAERPRLLSLAHRILGSTHDAEDAVQQAWLRAQSARPDEIRDPAAWLTTVTARLCLDQLRARRRREESTLPPEHLLPAQVAADEEMMHREDVSRALLVLLSRLSPAQRVAFVLHDLFGVPFVEVAAALGTSVASAKKQASRARLRLHGAPDDVGPAGGGPAGGGSAGGGAAGDGAEGAAPLSQAAVAEHARLLEAFLAAAREGRMEALLALLAPEAVRTAHPELLRDGARPRVTGARAVAEETRGFLDRIRASTILLVDGEPAAVIAPGGHPVALVRIGIAGGRIARVDIGPLPARSRLRAAPLR
ncbi:RNA polymerase sigma 70 [Brachybacterium phenoliresistens]|uniref:RNA polymerase sigma 70 n=1 Tax=Brachybacterium phenoliresistens TaxID=396014 RepID=Z9JX29_9MICO|nr:sigma-70 family RNA polymerase sigma factor [Brachybacterium phenoliresistens]EWS82347.1 RNA polymerase sigma 70 [Brachybacterium phenoliresistens]